MSKQELMDKIRPILEKGKSINDIIFISKKMSAFDIAFMLKLLRPTKKDLKPRLIGIDRESYGMETKSIYDFIENPILTGGGDGLEQLVFGCVAALDVYTENEILTVLEAQQQWREKPNE